VHRTSLVLHDGLHEFPARLLPSPGVTPAVGDWALFDRNAHGDAWIHTLVDPLNELARRDTGGVRQRLAANVDTALLVMGRDGDFNLRRPRATSSTTRMRRKRRSARGCPRPSP
jgi:ribosome biogenesis GTPase